MPPTAARNMSTCGCIGCIQRQPYVAYRKFRSFKRVADGGKFEDCALCTGTGVFAAVRSRFRQSVIRTDDAARFSFGKRKV